ncbi:MAG: metalloregulator ArsR/SmtB family transcription factor [Bacillota bacterium]
MERALQALADPTRRQILDLLAQREMAAGEIARHFPQISRPAVSQHLAVLREAGLVSERQAGRFRLYRLEAEPLREIWEGWLQKYQRFWGDRLLDLKRLVESEEWEEGEEHEDGDSRGKGHGRRS